MSPNDFQEWIAVLGKPTIGIVAVFVIVFYREVVILVFKTILEVIASWLKRK